MALGGKGRLSFPSLAQKVEKYYEKALVSSVLPAKMSCLQGKTGRDGGPLLLLQAGLRKGKVQALSPLSSGGKCLSVQTPV